MHKLFLNALFIFLGFCATLSLSAQPETENILYEQDFSEPGLPVDWTTSDLSTNDILWSWCADPTTGQMNGCPGIYDDTMFNFQFPFAATSAENGFMTLDSDAYLDITQGQHTSRLTTPSFDFSGEDSVWVKFETHIGVFNITPNNNALLRVSNDGGANWQTFNCFPEFPLVPGDLEERWSANPKTTYFNVSEVAAEQSAVVFQWQWKGREEYHWSIDDFLVSGSDPRPEVDLILKDTSFIIPENAIIPFFEIAPISFGAKIINQGSQPQLDTKLSIDIFNESNVHIFGDTILYEELMVNEETDFLILENTFTPPGIAAVYEGVYTIIPTAADATPENNQQRFTFEITENILAKERQIIPDKSTAPLNEEWPTGEFHSWTWGNYFFIKNGEDQIATAATFSIPNTTILSGKKVNLNLFEWTDINDDKQAEFSERNLVAFGEYTFNGSEPGDGFISVPLLSLTGSAELKNNQGYLLMLEYAASDDSELFINYSENHDYQTTLDYLESLETPRYASMLGIGNPVTNVTYSNLAFGFDKIPLVRLETDEMVGVEPLLPKDFQIESSPNPTAKDININFGFPESIANVTLNLYSQSGKLLTTKNLTNVGNERSKITGNNLAAGVYYLEILTDLGRRTMRVIKVR